MWKLETYKSSIKPRKSTCMNHMNEVSTQFRGEYSDKLIHAWQKKENSELQKLSLDQLLERRIWFLSELPFPLPPLLFPLLLWLRHNYGRVHRYSMYIERVHNLRGEYSKMLNHAWDLWTSGVSRDQRQSDEDFIFPLIPKSTEKYGFFQIYTPPPPSLHLPPTSF